MKSPSLAAAAAILGAVSATVTVPSTLSPAATTIISTATPSLFSSEAVQLTQDVLDIVAANIGNTTISDLFAFDTNSSISTRKAKVCKLLPGDALWPVSLVWDIFDILLGGALIKTTPLAAVCYPDWPQYDAAKCASITADWYFSELQ